MSILLIISSIIILFLLFSYARIKNELVKVGMLNKINVTTKNYPLIRFQHSARVSEEELVRMSYWDRETYLYNLKDDLGKNIVDKIFENPDNYILTEKETTDLRGKPCTEIRFKTIIGFAQPNG